MFIRSTHSLSFMLFSRPISILARPCNVPQVKAASASLGMHVHKPPNMLFHSNTTRLHSNKVKDQDHLSAEPSSKTLPAPRDPTTQSKQVQPLTDSDMERYIPGFSKLGVDAKLVAIQSLKSYLSTEIQKKGTKWNSGAYGALTEEGLDMKEKEIEDADTWYRKAFRSIAWGPTILINFIIAALW